MATSKATEAVCIDSHASKAPAPIRQAVELPEGIHVFERGWLSSNNILLIGDGQTALVDSGYCTHSEQTLMLVVSALGSRKLDILVNTHLHSDHCGGNASLQQHFPQLRTLIPPGHAAEVRDWNPVTLTYTPTGQKCPPFHFNATLRPGSTLVLAGLEWEIYAAPGHDPHSVILYNAIHRLLISADALWENGFGVVFPELEGTDAFAEVSATLDLIDRLNPLTVIPGHGKPFVFRDEVLDSARQRLAAFVGNPRKHARHAAKVLLKFKLLDLQQISFNDFLQWVLATPYFLQIHLLFFKEKTVHLWIEQLLGELVESGAARREGDLVLNA